MITALVLLSASLHAAWNALLRLEANKQRSLVAAIAVAFAFAALVAAVRWGLGEPPFVSSAGVGYALAAGALEAIYFATLARAMELGRLGVVYTVSRGGAVLAIWPLSMALFGERATLPGVVGSVLVLGGLALSGLGSRGANARGAGARDGGAAGPRDHAGRAAVGWALACAVAIAGYHLAYKAALGAAANPSACFALALGVSVLVSLARLGGAGRSALGALVRQRWPRLVGMGVVCGASFLLLVEALASGGSGYVLTLRNASVLFAVVLAWRIGERPGRAEVAGAALVAAGAALMAL